MLFLQHGKLLCSTPWQEMIINSKFGVYAILYFYDLFADVPF